MKNSLPSIWALPDSLRALIEAELDHGEKISWVGRPIPRYFILRSVPAVLFGLLWTSFSLFWVAGASGFEIPNFDDRSSFFPLFGIPFVLIGFCILSAPYWMVRQAKKTVYVLTNSRAIIFISGYSIKIRSFSSDGLTDLRRIQRPDGTGDLIFERSVTYDSNGGQRTRDHGFLAIPEVKAVEVLVRELAAHSMPK